MPGPQCAESAEEEVSFFWEWDVKIWTGMPLLLMGKHFDRLSEDLAGGGRVGEIGEALTWVVDCFCLLGEIGARSGCRVP